MHDTIPAWFAHTVATAPPENGIVFEGVRHGFSELDHGAGVIAAWLAERGVGRGTVVALALPNRMEIPLTHLALMKLGAVTLPLNTAYTAEELAYILADAGARVIVTDRRGRLSVVRARKSVRWNSVRPILLRSRSESQS